MKKLIYLMALGLIVNFGCTKEQSSDPRESKEQNEKIYVFNMDEDSPDWELTTRENLQFTSTENRAEKSNTNSAHTHGEITMFGGVFNITFSGTQNNGGSHGSGVFTQSFGPSSIVLEMETACVSVDDDIATYAGTFTNVLESPFPGGAVFGPFSLGNTVIFTVKDNGQGANAPLDQYAGYLQINSGEVDCGTLLPSQDNNWFDVEGEDDSVKIN